jgi:hypothetical protein
MVKFPFEFIILKMFIAETYSFSRKLPGKRKFSRNEISRNFAHFRIIFAFRENGKNRFRFNPTSPEAKSSDNFILNENEQIPIYCRRALSVKLYFL